MNALDSLLFWGIIVLLIVASLTRFTDWVWIARTCFDGLVHCFSNRSYAAMIASHKTKHHQLLFDMEPQGKRTNANKMNIFPRSRRGA